MIAKQFFCPVLDGFSNKMKKILLIINIIVISVFANMTAKASKFRSTDLPLPRFVSLDSGKVYSRAGPGQNYPIKWVYQKEHMPIEIIQEYEGWRKVRDIEGDEGWIHKTLLTGKRTVIIKSDQLIDLHEKNNLSSRLKVQLEPGVIGKLALCKNDWCKIETGGYDGWVERKFLWGIYEGEELN
jgi:SH3-like domain-containing protein